MSCPKALIARLRLMICFALALPLTALLCVTGCVGNTSPGSSDPSSDAPELEGRWCITGDESGFFGFLEMDATGDPITLQDNPVISSSLGEDLLILDGVRHNTNTGLQYSAIAKTTLEGTKTTIFVELHAFGFGFEVGALAMQFEGERVAADRLEGIAVTIQDFPENDASELIIQTATGTKDSCD